MAMNITLATEFRTFLSYLKGMFFFLYFSFIILKKSSCLFRNFWYLLLILLDRLRLNSDDTD